MRVSSGAAAASRDPHLTLRRVERQQRLVTILCRKGRRRTLQELAGELGVAPRTIARDIARLRHSGVPVNVVPGRRGGASIEAATQPPPVQLDLAEIAALVSSLAAVGPTVSEPAQSAMTKLVVALSETQVADPSAMATSTGRMSQRRSRR